MECSQTWCLELLPVRALKAISTASLRAISSGLNEQGIPTACVGAADRLPLSFPPAASGTPPLLFRDRYFTCSYL
jgi:hypothetical protein